MIKKIMSVVCVCICLIASCFSVDALDAKEDIFEKFIRMCYENEDNVHVLNNEEDITHSFLDENRLHYSEKEYYKIKVNINSHHYMIYIEETTKERASKIVSKTFLKYESGYDKNNKYFKEWLTKLYCRFSYNDSTGKITTIYQPSLTVDYGSWGDLFSPYSVDVSAYATQKSRLTVTFHYSYNTKCNFSLKGAPIQTLEYGYRSGHFDLSA